MSEDVEMGVGEKDGSVVFVGFFVRARGRDGDGVLAGFVGAGVERFFEAFFGGLHGLGF